MMQQNLVQSDIVKTISNFNDNTHCINKSLSQSS